MRNLEAGEFVVIHIPQVVIYRYKKFGIFNCVGITIVTNEKERDLEEIVADKTGRKKVTIIEHT